MKNVLVICDGMADEPLKSLGGKTPLETAFTPSMDWLALNGRCGLVNTVPPGLYPGSETAILTILGYHPNEIPSGRGPLEALGLGIELSSNEVAMRYILKDTDICISEISLLYPDLSFHPLSSHTGICTSSHKNNLPVDSSLISFWSADVPKTYESFGKRHRINGSHQARSAMIGCVPLLKGMAAALDMKWIEPANATGRCDTDFRAKGEALLSAIDSHDVSVLHIEACDTASHECDPISKTSAIENIDKHIVMPLLDKLRHSPVPFSIAVMSDHPSLCESGCHSPSPSPFLLYYPGISADSVTCFDEKTVAGGSLSTLSEIYV